MASDPVYQVLALKYGERDTTKCQFFYREGSHDKLTLHYFVWLILGGPYPILFDTGFLDDISIGACLLPSRFGFSLSALFPRGLESCAGAAGD